MPNPPKCPHPRGQYDVDCPVCDVKKRRAQRRRETRTGDGAPPERFSLRDLEDLLAAHEQLAAAISSIDHEMDAMQDAMEMGWKPADEDAINTLLGRRESLSKAAEAIKGVLDRHPAAMEARTIEPIRSYRRRK